ncbi:uncharacterized protein LOC111434845 [Cucurbita moschata]|uniref:Uncharacterized protein LOC111434845 n=1 Tax=Cucurbita moschata TaxID=3662 RepID=A0A6J1EJH3_CUCMO|nr:uncharacterized protein LOC111434845 [Cucurbita moschata]
MVECNLTKYSVVVKLQLWRDAQGSFVNSTKYARVIGGLRYLTHTRPNLTYVVGMSRDINILRYVNRTTYFGLKYQRGRGVEELVDFTDSDLAGDIDDRKSIKGMTFYLNENLISWQSQKQRTMALSFCETEFMAATAASCQALWLRNLLSEVIRTELKPMTLDVENKFTIALMKNLVHVNQEKRDKLDAKAMKCYFIGYDSDLFGYRF